MNTPSSPLPDAPERRLRLWPIFLTVFLAMTLIVGGDTAGKLLAEDGVSPLIVAWTRFAMGFVLILPFSNLVRAELPSLLDPIVIARGVLIAGGVGAVLTALSMAPMADVFGAFFVGPLVSFLLAALYLGERVTPWRTTLLGLGFVGVLMVVKPGFGTSAGLLFAVLAGLFHGTYLALTRVAATRYRPRFLLVSQLAVGAIVLAPVLLIAPVPSLTGWVLALLVLSALGSAAGNLLLVLANRRAPASVIAPLVYTQLIAATAYGWIIFGDLPDWLTLAGLIAILVSGLLSLVAVVRRPRGQP